MEALQLPTRKERQLAKESKSQLDRISNKMKRSSKVIEIEIGNQNEHLKIPASAFQYLSSILEYMSQGRAVSVLSVDEELTTQEAADILNVSRPHIVKLSEEGKIPFHKVGRHRRIKLKDLLAYKKKFKKQQREALDELTAISQEEGLDY